MNQASFHCPQCNQMRLFQSRPMNHTPHLLASIFLCGLWLPIWILLALSDRPAWHCAFCGFCDEPHYLARPGLRAQEAEQAAANAAWRAEQIAERGDLSWSERLSYWISDNQTLLIAIGIGSMVFGAAIFGLKFAAETRGPDQARATPSATPTPVPWSAAEQLEKRRWFARSLDGTNGFKVTLTGSREDILTITHLTLTADKAARVIQETWNSVPYQRAGFKTVVFQTATRGGSRWSYDVQSRSFLKN